MSSVPIPELQKKADARFPETIKEKEQVGLLKEITTIVKQVYQNPKAYFEVNAAIYSEHYEDERVLLKDLLFPEISPIYQSEKFKDLRPETGMFKKEFLNIYWRGKFPYLKKALGTAFTDNLRVDAYSDTALEIFSNSSGVSIYFPYSENFTGTFNASYFDNINTDPWGNLATVIPADREADSAPGDEPYKHKTFNEYGDIVWEILYSPVTVDDAYSEVKPTHIVGVGAEPARLMDTNPPTSPQINRVYHGWSKLTSQLDKYISFTGNGGGSEIKVSRISGYLQMADQQITTTTDDRISISYTRKEIKNKRWKRAYGVWDPDWKTDNLEQVYAAWEDDTQGTGTFTGSLTTTATVPTGGGSTVAATRTLSFNVSVKTQDIIVTQRKQDRYSYFRDAKNDQGWGFQMCDDKGCRYDDTFFLSGQYWPKLDEGSSWGFTWSYKTF